MAIEKAPLLLFLKGKDLVLRDLARAAPLLVVFASRTLRVGVGVRVHPMEGHVFASRTCLPAGRACSYTICRRDLPVPIVRSLLRNRGGREIRSEDKV